MSVSLLSQSHTMPAVTKLPITRGNYRHRHELRLLDACLEQLESAHENGQLNVPEPVAGQFKSSVPGLRSGMTIVEAMELVFHEQETHLRSGSPLEFPSGDAEALQNPRPSCMTRAEAEALTERIRGGVQMVSTLLLEAHDRQAWTALGYATWQQYVHAEFGISRSRSYELLDHGRVIQEVMRAGQMDHPPVISVRAAQQVRDSLPELTAEITLEVQDRSPDELRRAIPAIVRRLAAAHRSQISKAADADTMLSATIVTPVGAAHPPAAELDTLVQAIDHLAAMDDPEAVARRLTADGRSRVAALPQAVVWLTRFAAVLADLSPAPA